MFHRPRADAIRPYIFCFDVEEILPLAELPKEFVEAIINRPRAVTDRPYRNNERLSIESAGANCALSAVIPSQ